jgi:hypothetical protein
MIYIQKALIIILNSVIRLPAWLEPYGIQFVHAVACHIVPELHVCSNTGVAQATVWDVMHRAEISPSATVLPFLAAMNNHHLLS